MYLKIKIRIKSKDYKLKFLIAICLTELKSKCCLNKKVYRSFKFLNIIKIMNGFWQWVQMVGAANENDLQKDSLNIESFKKNIRKKRPSIILKQ